MKYKMVKKSVTNRTSTGYKTEFLAWSYVTENGDKVGWWEQQLRLFCKLTGLGHEVTYRDGRVMRRPTAGIIVEVTEDYIVLSSDPDTKIPLEEFWSIYRLTHLSPIIQEGVQNEIQDGPG